MEGSSVSFLVWISEEQIGGKISRLEIKQIVQDTLQLEPFYERIEELLDEKYDSPTFLPIEQFFQLLEENEFLDYLPWNVNSREIDVNVKLIKTSVCIYKRNKLTLDEIQFGIGAFSVVERDYHHGNIPLNKEVIQDTLLLTNKAISGKLLQYWIDKCKYFLEWYDPERLAIDERKFFIDLKFRQEHGEEITGKERFTPVPRLFPHEFLYIMCNAKEKSEIVIKGKHERMKAIQDPKSGTFKIYAEDMAWRYPENDIQEYLDEQISDLGSVNFEGIHFLKERNFMRENFLMMEQMFDLLHSYPSMVTEREFEDLVTGPDAIKRMQVQKQKGNNLINTSKLRRGLMTSKMISNVMQQLSQRKIEARKKFNALRNTQHHHITFRKKSIQPQIKKINYIEKNKTLEYFHPLNQNRLQQIKLAYAQNSTRPKTSQSTTRMPSYFGSTFSTRDTAHLTQVMKNSKLQKNHKDCIDQFTKIFEQELNLNTIH